MAMNMSTDNSPTGTPPSSPKKLTRYEKQYKTHKVRMIADPEYAENHRASYRVIMLKRYNTEEAKTVRASEEHKAGRHQYYLRHKEEIKAKRQIKDAEAKEVKETQATVLAAQLAVQASLEAALAALTLREDVRKAKKDAYYVANRAAILLKSNERNLKKRIARDAQAL